MVESEQHCSSLESYVLSIVETSEAANLIGLLPLIESWVEENGASLLTRRRTASLAVANIKIAHENKASFVASHNDQRDLWLMEYGCDVNLCSAILSDWFNMKMPGECLFVFDLDSTLIQMESIDEIARLAGVYEKVSEITKEAMEGKLDFCQAFEKRISLFKFLPAQSTWTNLIGKLSYTKGIQELAKRLKQRGCHTAIISGGFLPVTLHVKEQLGFDYCYSNELNIENGHFTGTVKGEIVDGLKKARILENLSILYNVPTERIVAIGDGANDLPMLKCSGYGIAFCAKPLVQSQVKLRLNQQDLSLVLDILGID